MHKAEHTVAMQPVFRVWSRPRQRYIALLVISLSLFLVIPQISIFSQSLQLLKTVDFSKVLAAIFCLGLTFPLAASTYHLLARRRLVYRRTLLVAVANMFTNRLLPAGTGSIATFFVYLRKRKHTVSQATSVVAVNNFMGFISHAILLVGLLIFSPDNFAAFNIPRIQPTIFVMFMIGMVIIILIVFMRPVWRQRLILNTVSLRHNLLYYRRFPLRLSGAFATSILLTVINALVLWFCVLAVGASISLLAALLVFTIGMVVGTATPTPGGLGGTEAGLLAGLISYSISSETALAAVVLYRLLSYWLTLGLGAVTYVYVERRGYLHRYEPQN